MGVFEPAVLLVYKFLCQVGATAIRFGVTLYATVELSTAGAMFALAVLPQSQDEWPM